MNNMDMLTLFYFTVGLGICLAIVVATHNEDL